jgi:Zn-dependent protease/CBS domain-containing protein
MNSSIRVGNLFGIPFFIHASWFLILGLVTWIYGSGLSQQFPQLVGVAPWILGFATALMLFASVLAHELGHSLVALQQGVNVRSITLFLFGGLANLERESDTPGEAFQIAIAGPAVSLLLFGLFSAITAFAPVSGPVAAILGLLASINLILALFNLIPGLPLDGGNVLKSIVWKITGKPYKGVTLASRVGQGIGWIAIASGLLPLFLEGSFGGVWNVLIGWFLLQNAGRSAQYGSVQEKLSDLTAEDAVSEDSPIVSANLSLREFANEFVIGKGKWRKFLVTDDDTQLIGTLLVDDLKLVATSDWPQTPVKELTKPVEETTTVKSNRPLMEVVTLLEEKKISELPVIGENGTLVGILEKSSIVRLLQGDGEKTQINPA